MMPDRCSLRKYNLSYPRISEKKLSPKRCSYEADAVSKSIIPLKFLSLTFSKQNSNIWLQDPDQFFRTSNHNFFHLEIWGLSIRYILCFISFFDNNKQNLSQMVKPSLFTFSWIPLIEFENLKRKKISNSYIEFSIKLMNVWFFYGDYLE